MTRAHKMISLPAAVLAASAWILAGLATVTMATTPPAAAVQIDNFTLTAGTTVTWTNGDDIPHTVVSKTGAFKSKVLDTGDRFSFTFAKPGQFGYYCSLHPHMTGTIVVKA